MHSLNRLLRFARPLRLAALFALPFAVLTAGCAPGTMAEQMPGGLGLPDGAPARPSVQYQYPAVHDMPPKRDSAPLDEIERMRLENELIQARDRQSGRAASSKTGNSAKKKPSGANQ